MKRGFTLTEMLIALALTAVAITIISEGVRHTLNFQHQLQSIREQRETQLVTLEAIRARLEHLVPAERPGEADGEAEILFDGQPRHMVFLSADPGYPSAAGVYEYTLDLTGGEDEDSAPAPPQLILTRRPLTDLDEFARPSPGETRSWTLPLSEPLVFGYAAAGASPAATWQDTASYPALVTLAAEGSIVPALTVRLPHPRQGAVDDQSAREAAL